MESEDQNLICKICLQTETEIEDEPNCHPCKCTGSLKYVHRSCLASWLNTKAIKKCELCYFEYRFNNIYKKTMPQKLNSFVVLKILFYKFCSFLVKLGKVFLNVTLSFFAIYSLSFMYSFIFLRDESLLVDYHFFGGPILSLLLYFLKTFNKKIDKKLEELDRRSYQTTNANVSHWYVGLRDNRTVEIGPPTIIRNEPTPMENMEDNNSEEVEEREEIIFTRNSNSPFLIDVSPLITLKACMNNLLRGCFYLLLLKSLFLFVPFLKKIFLLINCNFVIFLKEENLLDFTVFLLSISIGLICLTLTLKRFRNLYFRSKVATIIFLNVFLNPSLIGLYVKYCLYTFLNGNASLFINSKFFTPLILSINTQIVVNYLIGLLVIMSITKILCFYKELYRPGAFYFILTCEFREPITEIILSKLIGSFNNSIIGVPIIMMIINVIFWFHSSTLYGIKFQVTSFTKLAIYLFLAAKINKEINYLSHFLKIEFRKLTFFICKFFGCLDYFFGIKNHKVSKNKLVICPNKNELFDAKAIRENFKRPFNDEEYHKFYENRGTDSSFALFTIPSFFRVRWICIHLFLFLSFQFQIHLLLKTAFFISKKLESLFVGKITLEEIISFDILFCLCFIFILCTLSAVLRAFVVRRLFYYMMFVFMRNVLLISFKYFIWPTFIVLFMLYSYKRLVKSDILVVYSVSNTYICSVIIINCIIEYFINTISFTFTHISNLELLRRLLIITIIPSMLILCSAFYENMLLIKNIEIGVDGLIIKNLFFYCFIFALVLFFAVLFLKKCIGYFLNWREEFFLERRELLNYDGE